VIVFLALTLPGRYVLVRVVVGAVVVVAGAALAARWADSARARSAVPPARVAEPDDAAVSWSSMPVRFVRALARYLLILVPEYVVVVLLTGALSRWLSDFAGLGDAAGPLALLVVGVVGAALVIPTGGEIPVLVGLIAAGASAGVAGTLLVTLPALSLPSIVMVAHTFSWRAVAALSATVVVGGVVAGLLLSALT
jgi:uncharacterized membrane protein YraQ (UPF0718 family)